MTGAITGNITAMLMSHTDFLELETLDPCNVYAVVPLNFLVYICDLQTFHCEILYWSKCLRMGGGFRFGDFKIVQRKSLLITTNDLSYFK